MFTGFFYALKKHKVPVSITEWMTLMEALALGYITTLEEFYYIARGLLVKSETYFDHYDVAFQEYFKGVESMAEITEEVLRWLNNPFTRRAINEDLPFGYAAETLEDLMKELEKRLVEQKEAHDSGNYWIGRGGRSPFGHDGEHPAAIRIGGDGGNRTAVQIAGDRLYRNYRSDLTLDVRQVKMALKKLRQLNRIGPEDELDLDKTIDATAKNVGDLELIWRRERKNAIKLLLLMDAGGSMDPFAHLCSLLFTAANTSTHFKDFQYYYFHNCIYDDVFKNMETREEISTDHLLQTLTPDYKVVLVGDANMAPWELTERNGSINRYTKNRTPGIVWLERIERHFTHIVWLNPEEKDAWWRAPTIYAIKKLFPMYPLTLDGLGQAVKKLVVKR
jgi:uncharacterized protein with von Willebrand factor type A (vWA) domain